MEILINRSRGARRWEGWRGSSPPPHAALSALGRTRGSWSGCPRRREPRLAAEGVSPTFVPRGDGARPCLLPLLWQGITSAGAPARSARVAGDTAGSPLPSASPAPGFAAPGTPSKAGRGKSVGRTLSFRRRNVVSVPLPDSAPGIRCLLRSLNK